MHRWILLGLLALAGCGIDNGLADNNSLSHDNDSGIDSIHDGDADTEVDPYAGLAGVSGRICTPNEATWVGGATVWIETRIELHQTKTLADGTFLMQGIEPGIHTVMVRKGSFGTSFQVELFADYETQLPFNECLKDNVRIAVTTGEFDAIQSILERLGFSYHLYDGLESNHFLDLLGDPAKLSSYDIVFINCGTNLLWVDHSDAIANNLREYVLGGGSVYTSDMAYHFFEAAFPDAAHFAYDDLAIDQVDNLFGANQLRGPANVNATITDDMLAWSMGRDTLPVIYPHAGGLYATARSIGTARPLLRGSYSTYDWRAKRTGYETGYLGVQHDVGHGSILFTSYHNAEQVPTDLDPLMENLILGL